MLMTKLSVKRIIMVAVSLIGLLVFAPLKAQTVDVTIVSFAFNPDSINITPGTTVKWTNQAGIVHTSTSDGGVWNSGNLSDGDFFTFTFNTPGIFPYHCTPHPFMTAVVVVEGCCDLRGDIAIPEDGSVLVNDIVWLVNFLFKGGTAPACLDEGDCAAPLDGNILVNDIVWLVNFLFKGGTTPPAC
jgi:plastocyanin